ncbi:TPA: antirestriction protein ArdA [Clostridioides difficile]
MPYTSYDHDKLEAAETMRIERRIYFEAKDGDIAPYASLPIAQLLSMRSESAAAEQAIFDSLKEQAAAWEEQAGKTLLLDKALEYVRTPHVQHTANEWQKNEYDRYTRSNRVYQMNYYIYENTRYDKEAQKSIPYSWTLTWSVRTNSPSRTQAKIAGQDRKVFTDKAAMEKYLNGRIKAYDRLFTEISPPIPQEYADYFKVNGMLMPDYTIEGEEPPQQQQAAAIPENTGQEKEREHMSEQFSIMIGNRSRFEAGDPSGYWLDMPATKEQLHEAMRNVGITADNPQDFSIRGYSDDPEKHIALPYEMVCAADVDELNFLAAQLEQLDPAEVGKLNAALQQKNGLANIGQVIDFTYNVDFYVHIPEVHTYRDLGDYYLYQSGMVQMPEEWKGGIDLTTFGRNAAAQEKGAFTEYGYIVESGDEWERQFEGREVPEEYRIMSYPQRSRGEQDKAYMDAAETQQAAVQAAEPQQPRPVVPIILTSEKPAEKVKEITARLEQGVQAIFDSDRYKEFLTAMSKFHDYSLNNTILIAMQGGNLVMGFRQWEKEFDRHVKKGEKGIKIFAPAPYKVKKLVDKIDPETRKPMLDREGKVVKEETEITVPAFKVITVFDISQTEGKEFPDLSVKPLLADVEQYEDFFAALEKASPVPITFEQITNGANGYFSLTDKRIAIKEGVSELQAVKTAIHEIAHAKLHDVDLNAPPEEQNRVDRHTREVEAESVAYTVCQHFGLDTSDYSFGYVAGWSSGKEMTELKASLETIQATAKELITEIEGHFTELQQQRQAEQEQQTPVFDKLPPEQQQALSDTVKNTLQMLVDADKRIYGDVTGKTLEAIAAQGYSYKDGQLEKQQPEATPESLLTGETVRTPRGNFHITDMSREQIEASGFGFHHASEDGKYLIMGNGTQAYAIAAEQPQRDNPLKHVEDTIEQNDNNFDGIINNTPQTPTVADLEQRAKAGEAISVTDLAKAVKAEKREQPQKKPSILKKLDEYKKQAAQQPKDKLTPDYESAIGAIFINNEQELPENTKVYADFADNSYSFDLDAACVYYFSASADVAYAGDQNFTSMTFGANLDNDSVGAEGAIAYLPQEESENSVTAYYLYHDEEGVYFDTETYFDRMEITDQCAMTGIDYSCQVTFEIQQPTTSFSMIYYDENHSEISKTDYTPEEVTDYQTFELGSEVGSVEIICYDANGSELETMTITPDNPSTVICFDDGGQILASRYLRFTWEK